MHTEMHMHNTSMDMIQYMDKINLKNQDTSDEYITNKIIRVCQCVFENLLCIIKNFVHNHILYF